MRSGRTKMNSGSGGFDVLLDKWKDDPAFVAEGIALELSIALNKRLELLEMTRKELAERIHVTPGRVSQIMAGNINLTLLSICKVALAVGLMPSLELSKAEAATTPSWFADATRFTAEIAHTAVIPAGLQVSTLYSTTVPIASGALATYVGRVEAASPSLRAANEGMATTGQQRPGEAA
jgi:transcriptional regulator with XRE-family HTH domain